VKILALIARVFIAIDTAFQVPVDALMFAIMRATGLTKPQVRYILNSALVLSCASVCFCYWRGTSEAKFWHLVELFALPATLLAMQLVERALDESAERRGQLWVTPGQWPLRIFMIVMTALDIFRLRLPAETGWISHWWRMQGRLSLIEDAILVIVAYSRLTPPRPPAQRKTVLVPAREGA
jgi:hypothetical protein